MPGKENLNAALVYASKGWRVFPCHGKKKPAIKEWQRKASTDYTQIQKWWQEFPDALVAIATGEQSGIFVVDADGSTGKLSLLNLQENKSALPGTYTVKTPHGWHYYFTNPIGVETKSSASDLGEKLDIRGDGGYVIAPPSINEDGGLYLIDVNGIPANPPTWLVDLVRRDQTKKKSAFNTKVGSGGRNLHLAKQAGILRNMGLDAKMILPALKEVNFQQCTPPLPDKEVQEIAESIARYDPKLIGADGTVKGQLITGNLDEVESEPVEFRWKGVMPSGDVMTWGGGPGNGKSQMSCYVAARITRGESFPGDDSGDTYEPGNVLFISAEDAPKKTIKPRCQAAGADVKRIFFMKVMKSDGKPMDVYSDLSQIKTFSQENKIKLIVIDPLDAYLGMDIDSHASADMRRVLAPLQEMSAELNVIVILIAHLNKAANDNPLARVSGSGAIVNAARAVALFAPSKQYEGEIVMACGKANLARKFASFRYKFEEVFLPKSGNISRILFTGSTDETAESLFRAEIVDGKLEDALELLKDVLASAPLSSSVLDKRMKAERFSRSTFNRARGMICEQKWIDGISMWFLKNVKYQNQLELPKGEI